MRGELVATASRRQLHAVTAVVRRQSWRREAVWRRSPRPTAAPNASEPRASKRLWKRYGRVRNSLFTFLEHPEAPSDNTGSERELRPTATYRKVAGGFRSKLRSRSFRCRSIGRWHIASTRTRRVSGGSRCPAGGIHGSAAAKIPSSGCSMGARIQTRNDSQAINL